jgi:ring-1,2-phenylacetyl-CoA epoxidase subunit PaaC
MNINSDITGTDYEAPAYSGEMLAALVEYILHLADNALILGHRNSEWTGFGPILEQDIALSNIALDLVGQARNYYQYAATLVNRSHESPWQRLATGKNQISEDVLAYFRDAPDFRNCLLVEQVNGDWAKTIVRQFFFSTYQFALFEKLSNSADNVISAIAEKSFKEVTYHLRWSSEWVIRLGDGTPESQLRIKNAIAELHPFISELTNPASYELLLVKYNISVDVSKLRNAWQARIDEVFDHATIPPLLLPAKQAIGGKEGKHSDQLQPLLNEMQIMQRTYPGCEW